LTEEQIEKEALLGLARQTISEKVSKRWEAKWWGRLVCITFFQFLFWRLLDHHDSHQFVRIINKQNLILYIVLK